MDKELIEIFGNDLSCLNKIGKETIVSFSDAIAKRQLICSNIPAISSMIENGGISFLDFSKIILYQCMMNCKLDEYNIVNKYILISGKNEMSKCLFENMLIEIFGVK